MTRSSAVVLRALGLGDLLAGVPALRVIRGALPDHDLLLAAPVGLTPLVELADLGMAVHDTSGLDRPLHLRADVAVNLHGSGPQSHRLLARVAPIQIAFANAEADVDGPDWRVHEHERERWCRLVETSYDVRADPTDLRLRVPRDEPPARDAVVVHPGAKSGARRWPADRWASVVDGLVAAGHQVVVTGSVGERSLARRVAGDRARVLAGETDLAVLAGLVAHARAVVCGDTGIGHLAAAYRVSSVHLFGPSPPYEWGPPPGPHRVLYHGAGRGAPLADEVDPALLRIEVSEVLTALEEAVHAPVVS